MKICKLLCILSLLCLSCSGLASTFTWDGGGANSNWSTANNWTTDASPTNDGNSIILLSGTISLSPNVDQSWNIYGLTFGPTAGSFYVSGSQVTIGSGGIVNNSFSNQNIANSLVLASGQTWNAGATAMNIGGSVNNNGNSLIISGNNLVTSSTLGGIISGNGGLTKQGYGEWTLDANNTYTGTTTVLVGVLMLNNSSQLAFSIGSPSNYFVYTGAGSTIRGNIIIGDNVNSAGTATLRFSAPYSSGNNEFTYANQIANSSNVTVNSSGVFDLNGGNGLEYYNGSSYVYAYNDQTINALTVNGGSVVNIHSLVLSGSLNLTGGSIAAYSSSYPGLTLGTGITTSSNSTAAVISSPLNLNAATQTFSIAQGTGSTDLQVSGVISNGAILKAGSGSLLLSGANTFTGGVTINAGTVIIGNNSAIGTANLVLNSGALLGSASSSYTLTNAITVNGNIIIGSVGTGTLTLNGAVTLTGTETFNLNSGTTNFVGPIGDGGFGYGITTTGTGTMILSAANSFSGALSINSGIVKTANVSALGLASSVSVAPGGSLDLDGVALGQVSLLLSGSGSSATAGALTNGSTSPASYGGNITYSGSTTITAASGAITLNGNINGNNILTIGGNYNTILNGGVNTTGSLTKNGTASLLLSGSNNIAGGIVASAGTLQVGNVNALGAIGQTTMVTGGTLDLNGFAVGAEPVTLASGVSLINGSGSSASLAGAITLTGAATTTAQGGNLTLSGGVNGSSSILTVNGAFNTSITAPLTLGTGGLTKSGAGMLILSASSSYTGATTVSTGTIQLGGGGSLPGASALSVSAGATFDLNSNSTTIGSLSGAGNVLLETATLTEGVNNTTTAFSGSLSGAGSLIKAGTGSLSLTSSNNYSGTTIAAGTIILGNANALGSNSGMTTVNSGGTLDLDGQTLGSYPITLSGTGASQGGALYNSSATAASVSGTVTLASASTFKAGSGAITVSGPINGNTTLTIDGSFGTTLSGLINLGTGGLTKIGTGTLSLISSQPPAFLGVTSVNAGTIQLGTTGGPSIPGNLSVGDGSGSFAAAVVLEANSQIATTSSVTVNTACNLNLNGFSNTVASVSLVGGSLLTNGGSLTTGTLNITGGNISSATGNVQVNGNLSNNVSASTTTVTTTTSVNGTLLNNGSFTVNGQITGGAGVTNNGSITVGSAGSLTANGTGLDNESTVLLSGGVISGSGAMVNDGNLSGYGTVGGSGGFSNYSELTQNQNSLTLANTGANFNYGNLNLTSGEQLRLTGGSLSNGGAINLNGGVITGSALLSNSYGGTMNGIGSILSAFANAGGAILLTGGSVDISQAFTNSGTIQLNSFSANLSGGAISNTSTIQGYGNIANNIVNSGIIESTGGTLTLSGSNQNLANGLITADAGTKVLMASGLANNLGVINLTGGTFDNNGFPIKNSNQISGYGIFRSGGLTNAGSITFTGGATTVNGNVTNQAGQTISAKYNPVIFTGNVTNNGIFNSTSTTVTFSGSFTNNGAFNSDPSTNYFTNLTVGANGYLVGGTGDSFDVSKNFLNNSTQNLNWNTSAASLLFESGSTHILSLASGDFGQNNAGFINNFSWNTLELGVGESLTLESGTNGSDSALYTSALVLDGGVSQISSITGNGNNIYYNASNPANAYLANGTYALSGGGQISPVPEASTCWLFLGASVMLIALRGKGLSICRAGGSDASNRALIRVRPSASRVKH